MTVETSYLGWQFAMIVATQVDRALTALRLTRAYLNVLQLVRPAGMTSAEAARRTGITAQSTGA